MTGPEHYRQAEQLLNGIEDVFDVTDPEHQPLIAMQTAAAQVHATLALAAATALHGGDPSGIAWLEAAQ